jgi:hypothetical protein
MNIFLIGSGFTKSVFPKAPLNNDLLQALANDKADCASLKLHKDYETDDIEIALTILDVEIAEQLNNKNPWIEKIEELKRIRRKIETDIGDYFFQFTATNDYIENLPWLKNFADNAFSDGDVAVSLNYDCVFEGVLDCRSKWSPISGYGDHAFFKNPPLIDINSYPKSPVSVLKIHGSSSFVIAPPIGNPNSESVGFIFDEWFFPKSAKNIHYGYGLGKGGTYIIAPSYVKVPTIDITYFMLDALKAAERALNLIVICCGLRPEDTFLTTLLTNFLRQNNWCSRKIIIVDLKAEAIAKRIKAYWGVNIDKCIFPIEKRLENAISELITLIRD